MGRTRKPRLLALATTSKCLGKEISSRVYTSYTLRIYEVATFNRCTKARKGQSSNPETSRFLVPLRVDLEIRVQAGLAKAVRTVSKQIEDMSA